MFEYSLTLGESTKERIVLPRIVDDLRNDVSAEIGAVPCFLM